MPLFFPQNFLDPKHPSLGVHAAKHDNVEDKNLSVVSNFRTDQNTGMLAIYGDIGTIKVFLESWENEQRKIRMYKITFPNNTFTQNSTVLWSKIDRSADTLGDLAVEVLLSHKPYFQPLLETKLSKEKLLKFEQAFDSAISERTNTDGQFDDMPLRSALTSIDLTLDLSLPSRINEYKLFISNVLNTGITYGAVAGCKALFFLGKSRLTGQCNDISLSDTPASIGKAALQGALLIAVVMAMKGQIKNNSQGYLPNTCNMLIGLSVLLFRFYQLYHTVGQDTEIANCFSNQM